MHKLIFPLLFLSLISLIYSCKDEHHDSEYEYHAHILSPSSATKHMGDSLKIEVDFESHTGLTVHHINIRIYNKLTNAVVYNKPNNAHVHSTSGEYAYNDIIILSQSNGFSEHTNWVLEAKVWGAKDGDEEVIEKVEFHVEP